MRKFSIAISENGWEYTGYMNVTCKDNVKQVKENSILIDDDILLEFDEEIYIKEKVISCI